MKKLIYNARLVDADMDEQGSLFICDGKIESIVLGGLDEGTIMELKNREVQDFELIDAGGLTLMPAFIDMHAHFRDPGQLWKEDIASGMQAAAAAGGFSVIYWQAG